MKGKKALKIFAATVAILLIGFILFVTNAFVGNPISAMIANNAIEKHVENKYSSLDLDVEKARYNFKDGSYMARAKSKSNVDIHFAIYSRNGKIQRDNYDAYVLGMFNTLQRLSEEYSKVAKSLVAKELGYENNTTMVMYDKSEYEQGDKNILRLGMDFDKSLPLDAEVDLRLDLDDNSIENIAKVLTDAHRVFIDNGCIFTKYGIYAENDGMMVMVNNVTPKDIEGGKLAELIEEAKDNEGINGIRVFIKGEKK